ncbi:MAG: nitroreductase family protein [Bacteroidota bacterium]
MQILTAKTPDTEADLHPLIEKRWSPRSFSDQMIDEAQMTELLEAARWAASCNNEQPWKYVYAFRGTEGFENIWGTLREGNQGWAKNASVLVVSLARQTFGANGNPNPWAAHDLGMANSQLTLQAMDKGIFAHFMAGFYPEKVNELLNLGEDVKPVAVIALGYRGEPEALEEPLRSRELATRSRKELSEIAEKI